MYSDAALGRAAGRNARSAILSEVF